MENLHVRAAWNRGEAPFDVHPACDSAHMPKPYDWQSGASRHPELHLGEPPCGPVQWTERAIRRHLDHAAARFVTLAHPDIAIVLEMRWPGLDIGRNPED